MAQSFAVQREAALPPIDYSVSRLGANSFRQLPGRPTGLLERELGIAAATHGRVAMSVLRAAHALSGATGWQRISGEARVLHCLRGWYDVALGEDATTRIETGTCVTIPAGMPVQERHSSADLEMIEIVLGDARRVPSDGPNDRSSNGASVTLTVSQLDADCWRNGAGRREFLAYRNLGVATATRDRLHVNGIRAIKGMVGTTGWHRHSCGLQVVHQLGGWGRIEFTPGELVLIDANTCMCIPPERAHNEHGYSDDSQLIEVTIGEIGTTLCQPPC